MEFYVQRLGQYTILPDFFGPFIFPLRSFSLDPFLLLFLQLLFAEVKNA
jgi:hypothetical protein